MAETTAHKVWVVLAGILLILVVGVVPLIPFQVQAAEQIRVGVYENKPLVFKNAAGEWTGLYIDLLSVIASDHEWDLNYVPDDFHNCLKKLRTGDIDLMVAIAFSEDRVGWLRFSQENVLTNWAQVYTHSDSGLFSIPDLNGLKVAVLTDDVYIPDFLRLVRRFGLSVDLVEYPTYHKVLQAVSEGQAPAGIVSRLFGRQYESGYAVDMSPIVFSPRELRFAAPKNRKDRILAAIDNQLAQLKTTKGSAYYQLIDKWLSTSVGWKIPGWLRIAALAIAGLLLVALLFLVILRRQVRRRTDALMKSHTELERQIRIRRKAEEDLAVNMERYRTLFEASSDGIFVETKEGVILDCNDSAAKMYGYEKHELLKINARNLVPSHVAEKWDSFIKAHDKGGSLSVESESLRSDGSIFPTEVNTKVIQFGNENFVYVYVRDISKRVAAQQEKLKIEAQLRQQQKLESIGTLASGVAHEINNPIGIVMNYAELILNAKDVDNRSAYHAQEIIHESQRIATIVRNLLTFSRQEADSIMRDTTVEKVIDQTLSLTHKILEKDQIHTEVEIEKDLPPINCRPQQIQQVLMNLLTNARDALNSRYPRYNEHKLIRLFAKKLVEDDGDMVRIIVEDFGFGISKQEQERIFDPFYTSKEPGKGTGLGLWVSMGIITDHGGRLSVDSAEGKGTRFRIDLRTGGKSTEESVESNN